MKPFMDICLQINVFVNIPFNQGLAETELEKSLNNTVGSAPQLTIFVDDQGDMLEGAVTAENKHIFTRGTRSQKPFTCIFMESVCLSINMVML